jgi:hypothetical protein
MALEPKVSGQLSACTEWVEFANQQDLGRAVGYLLGCHRHNFIVLPDGQWSIVVSMAGMSCLREYFGSREFRDLSAGE